MIFACQQPQRPMSGRHHQAPRLFSLPSCQINQAIGFDEIAAINALVAIENQHERLIEESLSPFHGTLWADQMSQSEDTSGRFYSTHYLQQLPDRLCPQPMHCTIYACEALQAGFGDRWAELSQLHQQRWRKREYAGWSIAYLLCTFFDWKAYLILDSHSPEYAQCKRAFRTNKSYPVYRQPDIPLQAFYERGKDDRDIQRLLEKHAFGWGFSYQGWHTWVTRYDVLKECNWLGTPAKVWGEVPLFIKTHFANYHDYASHVICFPPKRKTP